MGAVVVLNWLQCTQEAPSVLGPSRFFGRWEDHGRQKILDDLVLYLPGETQEGEMHLVLVLLVMAKRWGSAAYLALDMHVADCQDLQPGSERRMMVGCSSN